LTAASHARTDSALVSSMSFARGNKSIANSTNHHHQTRPHCIKTASFALRSAMLLRTCSWPTRMGALFPMHLGRDGHASSRDHVVRPSQPCHAFLEAGAHSHVHNHASVVDTVPQISTDRCLTNAATSLATGTTAAGIRTMVRSCTLGPGRRIRLLHSLLCRCSRSLR
jgi:hypothetical protein